MALPEKCKHSGADSDLDSELGNRSTGISRGCGAAGGSFGDGTSEIMYETKKTSASALAVTRGAEEATPAGGGRRGAVGAGADLEMESQGLASHEAAAPPAACPTPGRVR